MSNPYAAWGLPGGQEAEMIAGDSLQKSFAPAMLNNTPNSGGPTGAWGSGGQEMMEITKAMSAGYGPPVFGAQTPGSAQPLMPESLEATLKVVTYGAKMIKFWPSLAKQKAFNTVEEYNRLISYGAGEAAFITEGALPEEDDSTYERANVQMKYLGTTRRVTHVASLVRTAGFPSMVDAETKAGAMWMLRQIEHSLFFGDSTIIPEQFDGFERQIRAAAPNAIIYDMRGAPLDESTIDGLIGTAYQAPNYAMINELHMSPGVKQDVGNIIRIRQRAMVGTQYKLGGSTNVFESQLAGEVPLLDNVFIREGGPVRAQGVGSASKRPGIPVAVGAAAVGVGSQFLLAGGVGGSTDLVPYKFAVVGVNKYGWSAPVYVAATWTPAATDAYDLTINDPSGLATGFILFRSPNSGTGQVAEVREMFRIPAIAGGATTYRDTNAELPATSPAFGFERDPQTMTFKQLAPMMRIPLATIDTSVRWMQVMYGAPVLYRPKHAFLIKNIGRDPNTGFVEPATSGW